MYLPHNIPLFTIAIILLWPHVGISQTTEPSALATLYRNARASYAEKQFQKSAKEFRAVADQCPGSELAIQCEYFAAMSDWAAEPCDACATKLSSWLAKAKRFQEDAVAAGRKFDSMQLLKWTENAELVHAKWDRQMKRIDLAEQRLRTLLNASAKSNNEPSSSPNAWLELGSLMLEDRNDFEAAKTCFENAAHCSELADKVHGQAMIGAALACWYQQQYASSKSILDEMSQTHLDDDIAIQAKMLRVKVAKALGEAVDVANTLDPVVRLALAGNPPAAVLYELAMALAESGESTQSNQLLLQIVHRFPNTPISIEVRVRLARNAVENKHWQEAVEWSDQAIQLECTKELLPFAYLIRGQAKLELGSADQARADLETALANTANDVNLEVSVRFHLAESLYQLQRWPEAENYWSWLVQFAESNLGSVVKPDWYSVVLLRSAELLALRKEWGRAEQMVLRIRSDFPKCSRACEVDYLLARCLVSKADFEAARQVLSSITQRTNSPSDELVARGFWMMGETYLMQRRYSEALIAYREGLNIPNQEYWSSASLLQIAKCCESTQDMQGARYAYEEIVSRFRESPFVQTAQERLRFIPSTAVANQTTNEQSSGTKR